MWGRNTHLVDGRVLALVGGPSLGRRLLRGLRHGGHRLPVHQARAGPARSSATERGAFRHLPVPRPRRARHVPPPLLDRHADGASLALGAIVLGPRGRAARADRIRGVRELQAQQGEALGRSLPLADPLLRFGGVLEPGRRRPLRLPDQPADRPLLHAGPQHDTAARPHRALRRLRHARHRLDAVLPAWPGSHGLLGREAALRRRSGR